MLDKIKIKKRNFQFGLKKKRVIFNNILKWSKDVGTLTELLLRSHDGMSYSNGMLCSQSNKFCRSLISYLSTYYWFQLYLIKQLIFISENKQYLTLHIIEPN